MQKKFSWQIWRLPLPAKLVLALILGCVVGLIMGPKAAVFGGFGTFVIKTLKVLAMPLVFFAIVDAFCTTEVKWKSGFKLLSLSTLNALVAIIISIGISIYVPVGRWVNLQAMGGEGGENKTPLHLPELSLKGFLSGLIPSGFVDFILNGNILTVAIGAVLVGVAFRSLKKFSPSVADRFEKLIHQGFVIVSKILSLVVHVVPLAAFAVIAKVVGVSGLKIFVVLGVFVGIVTLGMVIHVAFYYSALLIFWAKKSPRQFFDEGSAPLLTAFGAGSSLATLPVTLDTLQNKMKISAASSRLAACVGTNLNHDGILLYEAVAAFFIAQLNGISLTLAQKGTIAVTSLFAAVGIAGVPEAGLITLSLVAGSVGLPLSSVSLLLPVDWFMGRLRAVTNVCSDMIVATLLDR